MAEPAPAAAEAKEKSSPAAKRRRLGVRDHIVRIVSASRERSGVSLYVLKKELAAAGYDVEKYNHFIRFSLKRLVSTGVLLMVKGTGACGSFKLNRQKDKAKREKAKRAEMKRGFIVVKV